MYAWNEARKWAQDPFEVSKLALGVNTIWGPIQTEEKRKRKQKGLKNKRKWSEKKQRTSKEIFAFASDFAWCELPLHVCFQSVLAQTFLRPLVCVFSGGDHWLWCLYFSVGETTDCGVWIFQWGRPLIVVFSIFQWGRPLIVVFVFSVGETTDCGVCIFSGGDHWLWCLVFLSGGDHWLRCLYFSVGETTDCGVWIFQWGRQLIVVFSIFQWGRPLIVVFEFFSGGDNWMWCLVFFSGGDHWLWCLIFFSGGDCWLWCLYFSVEEITDCDV